MKVSEITFQQNLPFRKLKSKEFSLKKNPSTNQTSEKAIYSTNQSLRMETRRAQVQQFKLGNTPFPKQQIYSEPIVNFINIAWQIQTTPLQLSIHSSLMNAFKQEFISFKHSLTFSLNNQTNFRFERPPTSLKSNHLNGKNVSVKINNQKDSTNMVSETKPIDVKEKKNANPKDQVSCISFRKIENHPETQTETPDQAHYLSSINFHPHQQIQKKRIKTGNSPSLEFSPQSKEFRRSFQFVKPNPSQANSEEPELSILSTEKSDVNKRKSVLDVLQRKISNDHKVFVINKLLFLRDHI